MPLHNFLNIQTQGEIYQIELDKLHLSKTFQEFYFQSKYFNHIDLFLENHAHMKPFASIFYDFITLALYKFSHNGDESGYKRCYYKTNNYELFRDRFEAYRDLDDMPIIHWREVMSESLFSKHVQKELQNYNNEDREIIQKVISFVHQHYDQIIVPITHDCNWIKPFYMKKIIEFLNIDFPNKCDTMFDNMSEQLKNHVKDLDWETWVNPEYKPYIKFIENLNDKECIDLARVSLILKIDSLTSLVACKLAQMILRMDETEINNNFKIPENFKNPTREKIKLIVEGKPFSKFFE
jgi:hypothetical protein